MILTEEQKEELRQYLSELDENYICFGAIFVDIESIIDVIEKFLEDK